ncbi:hypothetical protein BDW71DRAFT_180869 [Aspergillus fruticulosus]
MLGVVGMLRMVVMGVRLGVVAVVMGVRCLRVVRAPGIVHRPLSRPGGVGVLLRLWSPVRRWLRYLGSGSDKRRGMRF